MSQGRPLRKPGRSFDPGSQPRTAGRRPARIPRPGLVRVSSRLLVHGTGTEQADASGQGLGPGDEVDGSKLCGPPNGTAVGPDRLHVTPESGTAPDPVACLCTSGGSSRTLDAKSPMHTHDSALTDPVLTHVRERLTTERPPLNHPGRHDKIDQTFVGAHQRRRKRPGGRAAPVRRAPRADGRRLRQPAVSARSSVPRAAGNTVASTAAATGNRTRPCTGSCRPACASTRAPRTTTNAAARRARPDARWSEASSATPPGRSSTWSDLCSRNPCYRGSRET
ncbi:hypothetical protein SUDANB96_05449 [Streptomyces sp. enrichment culture]